MRPLNVRVMISFDDIVSGPFHSSFTPLSGSHGKSDIKGFYREQIKSRLKKLINLRSRVIKPSAVILHGLYDRYPDHRRYRLSDVSNRPSKSMMRSIRYDW